MVQSTCELFQGLDGHPCNDTLSLQAVDMQSLLIPMLEHTYMSREILHQHVLAHRRKIYLYLEGKLCMWLRFQACRQRSYAIRPLTSKVGIGGLSCYTYTMHKESQY